MIHFRGRFSKEGGGLTFGVYVRAQLKQFIKDNPNMPFDIVPLMPESRDQRAFFEGGICGLIAFYQEGMDHHDWRDRDAVREWLKIEFNSDVVEIGGKAHKVAQSTKRKLNDGFLERVLDYVVENYQPPHEALDPKTYEHWRDAVFPYGGADNYIDYLVERGLLKK